MVLTNGSEDELEKKYRELCLDLNMDDNTALDAWQCYLMIEKCYTLEGSSLHWLACALYFACRRTTVPTVGRQEAFVEGNCISLSRLLRSSRLSLTEFFNKARKWADMANLPENMRSKISQLERNFSVSQVIFQKFKPMYKRLFRDPDNDIPKPPKSRKCRKAPCTSSEVFSFLWTLFVQVRGDCPSIADDLVNSYHLLLSCIDFFYGNALMANRTDLLNYSFLGLPEDFNESSYEPPTSPPCFMDILCEQFDGLPVEAKSIKEHWWKPYIKRLCQKNLLKCNPNTLSGILDTENFEFSTKEISKVYEIYLLTCGDFDERVFIGHDATTEIGTPAKAQFYGGAKDLEESVNNRRKQNFVTIDTLEPSTPLTGRNYLKEKEAPVTPVSTATQSVSKLQQIVVGRIAGPSPLLSEIFLNCRENPEDSINKLVKEQGEKFCQEFKKSSAEAPKSSEHFARQRLQLGETLYYKFLEKILVEEKKRLHQEFDLVTLLANNKFHIALFGCSLEIVLYSYNSQKKFPWILSALDIKSFFFYRVIEIIIRTEEQLSRDMVKHLNHIEEQTLDSLAWRHDSPLWIDLENSSYKVPTCEDVCLPHQLEMSEDCPPSIPPSSFINSQSSGVKRKAVTPLSDNLKGLIQSPVSSVQRFLSPVQHSLAKRRLFAPEACNEAPSVSVSLPLPSVTSSTSISGFKPGQSLLQNKITVRLPTIQGENGQSYFPVSCVSVQNNGSSVTVPAEATGIISKDADNISYTVALDSNKTNKPKKKGSLSLFFRKFFKLASVRIQELSSRLSMRDVELKKKIWTCFEYSITEHVDLMKDRHLDQIIMCAIYIICKVMKVERKFQDIMKCYRNLPQAASHVYRSVLLKYKTSKAQVNGLFSESTNSPMSSEKEENSEDNNKQVRSSSTLPTRPPSAPLTPTSVACSSSTFEGEERGDLITFYNSVYVKRVAEFALKFSQGDEPCGVTLPLSPLPVISLNPLSPRRKISNNHQIYLSPLKARQLKSPSRICYSFNRSPSKDLQAINKLVRQNKALNYSKRQLDYDTDVQ